ncbi:HalOD1 output domain-containing protein [Natrarchaeobius oligotrophus]|uniref:Response regulator n=1 Tax=Natrarchaeobius chitinivorans TaxID=1679083 RepID=A0A3N6M7N8_NATCH|nr:HalOD1 output domain-containing protein [Natrarchaeobius chitinivorans]RQG99658.1 response regulator [Natrarchaeobius chitinivorans]
MVTRSSPERTSITVLHVDDEPRFAEMVAAHLERIDERISVLTERQPREAMARLDTAAVDCILSDYQMPGMDGLEFLEFVRNEHPSTPFILYTANSSTEVARDAVERGADAYVTKDVGTGQFLALSKQIATLVDRSQAKRRLAVLEGTFGSASVADPDEASDFDGDETADVDGDPSSVGPTETTSTRVVRAVAEREGVDPVELSPPLCRAVDPQALDALVPASGDESDGGLESVTFTYQGYTITVSGDGSITVVE